MTINDANPLINGYNQLKAGTELQIPKIELNDYLTALVEDITGQFVDETGDSNLETPPIPLRTKSGDVYSLVLGTRCSSDPNSWLRLREEPSVGVIYDIGVGKYPSDLTDADAQGAGEILLEVRRMINEGELAVAVQR